MDDTGASCHMRTSLEGMYDLKQGHGGIKVGSGKLIKIEKVGKFQGKAKHKDGNSSSTTFPSCTVTCSV